MMSRQIICGLVLMLVLSAAPVYSATFNFDTDPFTEGIQNTIEVPVGGKIEVAIVLTDVDNLLGYSTNVNFNADLLALDDVKENPGDLNFDSKVSFQEINESIAFYVANVKDREPDWVLTDETSDNCFIDGNGNKSGVLLDLDGDNRLSFSEVNRLIGEYVDDVKDPLGEASQRILYWTDLVFGRQGFEANESVEVADPPAISNKGNAGAGVVADLTAVLLARPADAENGRAGFGFDTSTLGPAVLMTLRFEALSAGTGQLTFGDAVYILEDFADIQTDVKTDATTGVLNVKVVE